MGYTDAHGRPELVAQPFIAKGAAAARVVDTSDVDDTEETAAATDDGDQATPTDNDDPTPA